MSPSSARDPFDDGNAPWTGGHGAARPDSASQDTRPLPRPGSTGPVSYTHLTLPTILRV